MQENLHIQCEQFLKTSNKSENDHSKDFRQLETCSVEIAFYFLGSELIASSCWRAKLTRIPATDCLFTTT